MDRWSLPCSVLPLPSLFLQLRTKGLGKGDLNFLSQFLFHLGYAYRKVCIVRPSPSISPPTSSACVGSEKHGYTATSIYLQAASRFANLLCNRLCVHVVQHTDISALAPQRELYLIPFTSRLARVSVCCVHVPWVGMWNILLEVKTSLAHGRIVCTLRYTCLHTV